MNLGFLIAILLSGPVTDGLAEQSTVVHLQDAKITIDPGQRIRMFPNEGKTIQLVIDEEGRSGVVTIQAEHLRVEQGGKVTELRASGGRLIVKTYEAETKALPIDKQ